MSRQTIVTCEECGAQKGTNNGWWNIRHDHLPTIEVRHFEMGHSGSDYCGVGCLHKAVDRWLATGSVDKNQPAKPIAQWDATGEKP